MNWKSVRVVSILFLVAALVLPVGLAAQEASEKDNPASQASSGVRQETLTIQLLACSLCFTCGGVWNNFSGSFTPVGNNPTERGSSCSGSLATRSDSRPFLCCR
jgi:hypothetical protein